MKGYTTTIITAISKTVVSFLGFAFVDDADLATAAENTHTSGSTMIKQMQALMTCWRTYFEQRKVSLSQPKQDSLPSFFGLMDLTGSITPKYFSLGTFFYPIRTATCILSPGKKLSKAYKSLGLRIDLCGTWTSALDDITHVCQEFLTQMNSAKCDKTSCLNAFNTSCMPTLSYRMIATQFTEKQWNKAICPAILMTCCYRHGQELCLCCPL